MSTPAELSQAYEAFFNAATRGDWRRRPDDAAATLERRRSELRSLAAKLDPSLWPPGVATLLWQPADHHEPTADTPANALPLPELGDDG